ncbi:Clr5 domain-containing protein [Aspergillus aurantiobrunneus]
MMEGSIPSSNLSTPPPTSSSSPAASVFRPRRSEDWNKFRPIIEQLYRDDQLKLKDVKNFMERHHKFLASEKQYKDRLAAWNVRKNIKAKEVNIMIRKQQKRAAGGKQTAFRVAGQQVDTKRITRFVRRYGTSCENNNEPRPVEPPRDSPEPTTPSDMSYYTPEPDERATTLSPNPDSHAHPYSIPDSERDETKSLPISLRPGTSASDLFAAMSPISEDPWGTLAHYQKRLVVLGHKLDSSTANLFSPDEPIQHQQH